MKRSIYKNTDELPMFLTVMDVANLLGLSRASAYELVRESARHITSPGNAERNETAAL